ncbi:hypothetical protein F8M41_006985 [Gigaspora margarita]|uniref:Uncharacterized protein n=1 Tax=Gigaspora margarita TaxID=4874 RepID=A0A8H4A5M3_GIGMA|nr:hypothetical protein F8M41_006985 [Gigaspora margarita]
MMSETRETRETNKTSKTNETNEASEMNEASEVNEPFPGFKVVAFFVQMDEKKHSHPNMKLFFEDLILERKKRMAQRNFINTSIDVLDEARTYGAKELISDMPKALGTKSTKRRSIDNGTNKIVDVSVSQSAKKVSTEYNLADNNLSEDYLSNFFLRTFIQVIYFIYTPCQLTKHV